MNKLFDETKKQQALPFGHMLEKEIYINRSQKLDIHGEAGVDNFTAELIKQDWVFKKKKATKLMSLEGRAAMFYLYINDNRYLDVARVQSITTLAGWTMEAILYSERLHTFEGTSYPVALRFTFDTDHYVLSRIYVNEQKEVITIGDINGFHYPVGEVPVEILRNNVESESDVDYYGVRKLKERINYWGKQIGEEWRLAGKSRQTNRTMYGDGSANSQFKKRFDENNDTIEQGGINSKLSSDALPNGGIVGGVGTAASMVSVLSASFRDTVMLHNNTIAGSGTNKHGLEIGLSHQPAIDNLLEQKAERDRAYSNILTQLFATPVAVSINLSPITTALIESTKLDVAIKADTITGGE